MTTGDYAFSIVQAYSEIGNHRTGTQVDKDTVRWLDSELTACGAEVLFQKFPYHHFDAHLKVQSAGNHINAEALHYSFAGQSSLRNPAAGVVDAHADEAVITREINALVAMARADRHDGLILGTMCPTGIQCNINRTYESYLDFPVVLVAPQDLATIRAQGAEVSIKSSIHQSQATNVIAQFPGPKNARHIVVTTPISGWFRCAGERGCGIAVAIIVSKRLSEHFAVDLLLASGHELGFLGGFHLANNYNADQLAVLHLGSCIANSDAQMTSVLSAEPETTRDISEALKNIDITPTLPADATNPDDWIGESMCWAHNGRPMLSVAGQAPNFHTPCDLPERVTSADLLERSIDAIERATLALVLSR
ncbi:hypothetical protein O4H61_19120 [Roseovarius aestuarii]|nr:hypothetical protein [Roseovarius aestuarii]